MYTLTFDGNSSDLSCDFFPPLEVGKNARICLLSLQTNNAIPNITEGCNKINFQTKKGEENVKTTVILPTGSYEITDLEKEIVKQRNIQRNSQMDKRSITADTTFELKANYKTLKCEMLSNEAINFLTPGSIHNLLGFDGSKTYEANVKHESNALVNVMKVNCIYIESNLVTCSFRNGRQSHTIHEFYPSAPPGYKIIEIPRHLVFYPLNTTTIGHAKLVLRDQDGELINLRGEPITVRVLIETSDVKNGTQIL